jgi:hypothetical protein
MRALIVVVCVMAAMGAGWKTERAWWSGDLDGLVGWGVVGLGLVVIAAAATWGI